MDPGVIVLLVFLGLFAATVVWFFASYNGLVKLRNIVKNSWSQIDVQLKRRHDLIPNLVETVKGYAGHEKETLENVIKARSQAVGASGQGAAQQAAAERGLSGALGRLMLVVEQYPDLKANENFLSLQEELTATENRITFARQHYNDNVMRYNTRTQTLPVNVVAGMFNFKEESFFELEDASEKVAPKVAF